MTPTFTAFAGSRRIAAGSLLDIAPAVKTAFDAGEAKLLVFDDASGRISELDLRGSVDDVLARLRAASPPRPAPARGRPKLGVTAREVTLLPAHWDWLAAQPGGASAALRRLVDQARRAPADKTREALDAAYRIMSALAGDLPGFEEATRAFYAGDHSRFHEVTTDWPADIGDYVRDRVSQAISS